MIGWKPKPFIFVHIPKCAGTSLEQVLIPYATARSGFRDLNPDERSRHWLPGDQGLQHSKLRRYAHHFRLPRFFKFAFVRNPWDRAISQIEYLRGVARARLFFGKSFKEQIRTYCQATRTIWAHDLKACQVDYLIGLSGEVEIDFIGRFESLEQDFRIICERIGIENPPELPHIFNSKRRRHYSLYYDDESAEWVSKRFARDIEFLNYQFEWPSNTEDLRKGPNATCCFPQRAKENFGSANVGAPPVD